MILSFLIPIVITYSIFQSLFGVGLLVFGTPTLLLLGYEFEEVLGLLLLSSITINSLQLITEIKFVTLQKRFILNFIPFVTVGLMIVLIAPISLSPKLIISILLILTALLRVSKSLHNLAQIYLRKSLWLSMPILGLIHGLTNMGGGLLTILISSLYEDKRTIRANVAFGYLIMASSQCLVLLILKPSVFTLQSVLLSFFAAITYALLGKRIFNFVSNPQFQLALTVFIFFFGIALLF